MGGMGAPVPAPTGPAADPATTEAVKASLAAALAEMRKGASIDFGVFLVEPDANAAMAFSRDARRCRERANEVGALGEKKAQYNLTTPILRPLMEKPQPWLPSLRGGFGPEQTRQFTKEGEKVRLTNPEAGLSILLAKEGETWKIEFSEAQRASLKLVQEFYAAQLQYIDAVAKDVESGAITRDNFEGAIAEHFKTIVQPVWAKTDADIELAPPAMGPR